MNLKYFILFIFILKIDVGSSQSTNADSLKIKQLVMLLQSAEEHTETNPDSSLFYASQSQLLAVELNLPLEEVCSFGKMGYALINKGDYARALKILLVAVSTGQKAETEKNVLDSMYPSPDEFINRKSIARFQRLDNLAHVYQYLGILYANGNNYEKALQYTHLALQLTEETGNTKLSCITNITLGRFYLTINKPDSALLAAQKSHDQAIQANYSRYLGSIFLNIGRIHLAKGNRALATVYFHKAKDASNQFDYKRGAVASGLQLSNYYTSIGKKDSTIIEINEALVLAQHISAPDLLLRCYNAKSHYYKSERNNDSVVKYLDLSILINNGIFNSKQLQQFQNIDFDEQQRLAELENEKEKIENRNRVNLMLIALGSMFLIAILLYQNNRQKLKANSKLEITLNDLKSTQAQLIQSEKMASLGELTAGIAHEIQNPLNFVNNFSELNGELANELDSELTIGNMQQAKDIVADIKANSEKINQHGQRASSIVKVMLEHSRKSSGEKEPTDINKLCDEFVRLSYHGLRAKDSKFNCDYKLDLDPNLPLVNVVSQDIGRVILNIVNNAFQACFQQWESLKSESREDYKPCVTITTTYVASLRRCEICISDNGPGIPDSIRDKIFQPFFTTKPTGQGTGLGLSLAYDIVKAHGGTIEINSLVSQTRPDDPVVRGTKFTIHLPY